jgi:hypothetical protein
LFSEGTIRPSKVIAKALSAAFHLVTHRMRLGQHRLRPGAVTGVATVPPGAIVRDMAQMLGQLRRQGGLEQSLSQPGQQPTRANQLHHRCVPSPPDPGRAAAADQSESAWTQSSGSLLILPRQANSAGQAKSATPSVGQMSRDIAWVEPRVELRGLEPLTPSLRTRCATSCATAPGEDARGYQMAMVSQPWRLALNRG